MSKEDELKMKEALARIIRLCVDAREQELPPLDEEAGTIDKIEEEALNALFK